MGGGRLGLVMMALGSSAVTVAEAVTKTEARILNVPMSMLYVAIAGTMIGFFLLPAQEAARVSMPDGKDWRIRAIYTLFSILLVGVAAVCYAFASAWAVQAGVAIVASVFKGWSVNESAILPITGLVGIGIRPWLPSLLKAVERRADRVIGGSP